jgi:polysaccharide biosynthesis protein PslH
MKIAFVSLYEAYPPTSGAAYVTYNCAKLTPCTGLLVQFAHRKTAQYVANLTIVSLGQLASSRLQKLACMPLAIVRIRKEIAKFKPDYVVLEGASWAVYLMLIIFVLRITLPSVKIVYHAHNVEYLIRKERNGRVVSAFTWCAERYILATSNLSFAVSQEDRQRFSSLYGITPQILPNGVDCNAYHVPKTQIDDIRKKFAITNESILFMGLYAYPPNTEAVRFLIDQVMPQLHQQRPNVRLVITGGGPPCLRPWLINTGVISRRDLNAVLCACTVGVAPIFKGSGTRLKILEYMAAGLPVVTTKKGAEGLSLENEKHVLYAETAAEFQKSLLRLFCDQSLSKNLSAQATTLVRSKFDWVYLLQKFALQLENF